MAPKKAPSKKTWNSPPPPRGARTRALLTVERLRDPYTAVTELSHENPFQLLIATILSAQTTDRSVNLITPELFRRWPTAYDLAGADPAEVEKLIKPTGFFRAKTQRIIAASRALVELFGGVVPQVLDDLVKIPGIGRKTANVILGAGFGVPGFAVDTHVIRLTNRIGMVRTSDPVKIEFQVCSMVPKEEWTALSLRLILHGRRICDARRPLCAECVLNDFCPSSLTRPGRRLRKGRPIGEAPGSDIKVVR
ncbi:MAG TPA: endonuclease III [Candidatus Dormibacteraeota bacterium]|nr:endonuclease III [Candidatus Dormibacteraeota bacterium]HEV2477170.1 endonuclease III [Candidatus Dormibacteraeota bacterium]